MNCVIVEDDIVASKVLEKCISRQEDLTLQTSFANPLEAIEYLNNHVVDLVFLDIEMGELNGLELIDRLEKIPLIIIISAKKDYAAESYNFDVVDYIVKPLTYERFLKAYLKAQQVFENFKDDDKDHFYVKQNSKYIKIDFKDILYIEALADYVHIYLEGENRITVLSTMKAFNSHLPLKMFARIHRSYIINLSKITMVEENDVHIQNKMIPISRQNKSEFMALLNKI